jgi:catechol 2,3-dioxygenase-like lactoylglutathione lyase family enzyme
VTVLDDAAVIAFLPSTDLDRSRRFFADLLGLPLVEVNPFACVLRVGPTMVRVTKVDQLRPQPFTVFGFEVPDIRASAARLAGAGVAFLRYDGIGQDDDGIWTAPNDDQVAWFQDPDGNTLSLTRFA